MAILVTGARGFTGQYVCAELDRRHVPWYPLKADLRDFGAVQKEITLAPDFDAVIHLAGVAFANHNAWQAYYDVNQIGTFNLLNTLSGDRHGIRCIIASSAQVYGSSASGIIDETSICRPENHYGVSKYAMELGTRNWAQNLEITIARPFNYTGVGQSSEFIIPKIVDHFKKRQDTVVLGNTSVRRDFGDVRTVASVYCDLALSSGYMDVVNIGSGNTYSIMEIIDILSDLTNHKINVECNPLFIRKNDPAILGCDAQKLQNFLSNKKSPAFSDTLQWMLEAQ